MDSSPVLSEITTSKKFTKDAKNSSSSFITKMHQILQDLEIQHLINWNSDGTAFQITNILKFSNTVLPKYFKHRNYSSFVRQLNMYGFRKMKTETAESSFSHENFKRDEVASHKIKRLKMKKNQSDDEDDEHFIEKYSGPRRAAAVKNQPQNTEVKAIHEQLSQLTDKFKLMQDTTNDLRKTVLSQNNTIKTLMTELLQARIDGEKKYKTLVSDISSGMQSDETYADQNEQIFESKTQIQNPAVFGNLGDQDLIMPKANSAPKFQDYYDNSGLDNIISNNGGGWYKTDSKRELNNGQAINKAKLNGNQMLSASREAFNPFNQVPKGRNGHQQGKPHYYESVNPYPYFERSFQASQEQAAANSYELSRYEAQKLFPELYQELCTADDDQDRFEEQHYQPHKKIQKLSLRNGAYPINGEPIQSYN